MPTNSIQAKMIGAVTQAIGLLYQQIASNLSSPDYPKVILANTKVQPTKVQDSRIEGSIVVDASEDAAPMALAFELGSGIWSERGERKKYLIEPKEGKKVLNFEWPNAASIGPREGVNKVNFYDVGGVTAEVYLPSVAHPGIRAKPYLQPAIEQKSDEIAELIGDEFLLSLSAEIGPDVIVIK